MAKAVVDQDTCVGCEACVGVCPTSAISVTDGKAKVDADTCVECGACVATCPVSAIAQKLFYKVYKKARRHAALFVYPFLCFIWRNSGSEGRCRARCQVRPQELR